MRTASIALSLLVLSFASAEEKPLPKDLPPYGADRPLPKPELRRRTLPNGLTVWLVPREGLPRVTATLAVKGGTASDAASCRGISGIMAGLLKDGTAKRDSRALAEDLQAIGGELYGWAAADGVYVRGGALSSGAPALLEVLGEIARTPAFPDKEVELTRERTLAAIQGDEAEAGFVAGKAYAEAVYGDHPYRYVAPEAPWVKALDRDQLLKAHQARFVPGQALLLVVGQFDAKAVDAAIDRAFGSWKAGVQALPSVPPVNSAPRPGIVIKNRPDSVQTAMVLGRPALPAGHPDLPALSLAVEVAGGSFGSRITRNIREDKGYTYSPWMAISKNLLGGQLSERAAVRNAVTGAAVTEIFYELARMGTSEVPAEELAKAKRSLGGGYLFQTLTLDAYSMALASAWTKGQPAESLAAWVPQIQAVTAADVKKAARTYLNPRDFTVVAVGDEALIKEELAPFQPQR